MSSAEQRYTVIVTQFVTAGELRDQNHSSPLFIEDGVEAPEPGSGIRTSMARMVSTVHDKNTLVEGSDGEEQFQTEIVVDFADATPSRVLDPDEIVEIRRILPGVDLLEAVQP
jgi:hypothetical protein